MCATNTSLACHVGAQITFHIIYITLHYITPNRNYTKSGEAKKNISKAVEALKQIEVPKETNRLLEFLKGGKK